MMNTAPRRLDCHGTGAPVWQAANASMILMELAIAKPCSVYVGIRQILLERQVQSGAIDGGIVYVVPRHYGEFKLLLACVEGND